MKNLIIFLFCALFGFSAFAADTFLTINLKDGKKETYAFSKKPVMTFDAETLTIKTTDLETTYQRADICHFNFVDEGSEGVDEILSGSDVVYSYRDYVFSCEGHAIEVYNLSGVRMLSGSDSLSLESLPAGVYLVKAANQTIKVIR